MRRSLHWVKNFGLVFSGVIFCLAAANAQDSAQTGSAELDTVRVEFHAAVKDAAKPLVELLDQYAGRLAALQAQATKDGELEAVLEIKGEFDNFRSGISAEAEKSTKLQRAQKIYRDTLDRRRGDFRQTVQPLLAAYQKALLKLESDLTSAGELEKAIRVRGERQRMADLLAGDLSRVAIDLGVLPEGYDPSKRSKVTVIPEDSATLAAVSGLTARASAATNRSYTFNGVPEEFEGFNVLRMEVRGNLSYRYQVTTQCKLYLLMHSSNVKTGPKPEDERWKKLEPTVIISGGFCHVFEKEHKPGEYELSSDGPWPYMLMSEGEIVVKKKE